MSLSKAHRDASGLKAGDAVTVTLELEEGRREVDVPSALQDALERAGLVDRYASLAYSKRKELARLVSEAKTDATRARRVEKALDVLR